MQMSYRRRGGLNGRGAIIRPPGWRPHIMSEEMVHEINAGNATTLIPNTLPHITAGTNYQMPNVEAATQTHVTNLEATIVNHAEVPHSITQATVQQEPHTTQVEPMPNNGNTGVSDERGNPEKIDLVLHPNGLW